jgi:hypothetical protein
MFWLSSYDPQITYSVTELPEKAAKFKMQVSGGKLPSKLSIVSFGGTSPRLYLLLVSAVSGLLSLFLRLCLGTVPGTANPLNNRLQ